MSWDVEAFKEKLEGQHSFPGIYKFKFIVTKDKVAEVEALLDGGDISLKPSSAGKYVSVTSNALMQNSDDIVDIYRQASEIEGCIAL